MADETIEQYLEHAWPRSPFVVGPGGNDVFSRSRQAIRDALYRLDALPRSDPFWDNTNKRPTIYKLDDYCQLLLSRNPYDVGAIWCGTALAVRSCTNDFGSQYWRALHVLGALQARWPIEAACSVELGSGVPTVEAVAALLAELGLHAEGRAALMELRMPFPGWEHTEAWAQRVMAALDRT